MRCSYYIVNNQINHKVFQFVFYIFLTTVMHNISAADFPLFCSNSARSLILPVECSPQKSLILLEILPADLMQS